jgi:uncharacterized membrane protein YphA (DoxX/SURF4 family)
MAAVRADVYRTEPAGDPRRSRARRGGQASHQQRENRSSGGKGSGTGITGTTAFFTSVGLPAPHAFAYVAGILEFFGGIAIALGLLTVAATVGLIIEMIIAVASVSYSAGFFVTAQKIGWELNVYLIGLLAAVLVAGPGRWSADAVLGLTRRRIQAPAGVPSRQDAPI